jgi:hypothetical protein
MGYHFVSLLLLNASIFSFTASVEDGYPWSEVSFIESALMVLLKILFWSNLHCT